MFKVIVCQEKRDSEKKGINKQILFRTYHMPLTIFVFELMQLNTVLTLCRQGRTYFFFSMDGGKILARTRGRLPISLGGGNCTCAAPE